MAVLKVGFVGFRTGDLERTRAVLEGGLGLDTAAASASQVSYRLADGTLVEAFDRSEPFHQFFTSGPVVGFVVDDFDDARRRLAGMGLEFLSDVQADRETQWVHFRFPDGTVAELMGVRTNGGAGPAD